MKRVLVFVLVIGVLLVVAYALLRWVSPDLAKQIALYAIGLGAFVAGTFKKILSFFGSDRALDRAEGRNREIEAELERIKAELAEANRKFEAERATHQREIGRLERILTEQRQEAHATGADLARMREMDVEEYLESLTPEERRALEAEMMDGVVDGPTIN